MVTKSSTKNSNEPAHLDDSPVSGALDLEFPDWGGHQSHQHRMTFEQACRWNEEMLALFVPRENRREQRFKAKSLIPFQL